jgi:hypothetical protein
MKSMRRGEANEETGCISKGGNYERGYDEQARKREIKNDTNEPSKL